jgi:hypothetical protein
MNDQARDVGMNARITLCMCAMALASLTGCEEIDDGSSDEELAENMFSTPPEGGWGPAIDTPDDSTLVATVTTPLGSELRFIDENPDGDPDIGVVEIAGGGSVLGTEGARGLSALELFLATASAEAAVPEELRVEHELLVAAGLAPEEPRPLAFPRLHFHHPCGESTWQSDFENEATYRGITVGEDNVGHINAVGGSKIGNLSTMAHILAGACNYAAGQTASVRMEIKIAGLWQPIAGTPVTLAENDPPPPGYSNPLTAYWYHNYATSCTSPRRIWASGSGTYRLSGAWEDDSPCET